MTPGLSSFCFARLSGPRQEEQARAQGRARAQAHRPPPQPPTRGPNQRGQYLPVATGSRSLTAVRSHVLSCLLTLYTAVVRFEIPVVVVPWCVETVRWPLHANRTTTGRGGSRVLVLSCLVAAY